MHSTRLPHEDRCQGLAERPAAAFSHERANLSGPALSAEDWSKQHSPAELDPKAMARQLECACGLAAIIERVAARHGLLPSIIAGFCSRRSGLGLDLDPIGPEGTSDFAARALTTDERQAGLPPDGLGFARGLTGLDFDWHAAAREPDWRDPVKNIEAAVSLITGYRRTLRQRTTLQGDGLLRASFAAFECGFGRIEHAIRLGFDVDSPTLFWNKGNDQGCGQDVLLRAGFFQTEGWD